jgi:hypothetical protein
MFNPFLSLPTLERNEVRHDQDVKVTGILVTYCSYRAGNFFLFFPMREFDQSAIRLLIIDISVYPKKIWFKSILCMVRKVRVR